MYKKIAICGAHGTGKTTIVNKVFQILNDIPDNKVGLSLSVMREEFHARKFEPIFKHCVIQEVFRDISISLNTQIQDAKVTAATFAKQLYYEEMVDIKDMNCIIDRTTLDTFVYYDYFNKICSGESNIGEAFFSIYKASYNHTSKFYDKIFLIEPSNREISNDGFRMIDKNEQLDIHKLFLKHFKQFDNVVIVNQEEQDKIIDKCVGLLSI